MTDDQINEALVDLRRSMHDGTAESAQRLHKRHDELLTLLVQRAVQKNLWALRARRLSHALRDLPQGGNQEAV